MNALTRSLAMCLVLVAVATLSACDSSGGDGITATGTVENTFGNPIEEATVRFTATDLVPDGSSSALGGGGISCVTDEDGDFSCEDLSLGTYDVEVTASGYEEQNFTVEIAGDEDVDVPELVGSASINAPLVNALTGAAVGSAPMHCHRGLANGEYSTNVEFETTSSPAGQVLINNVFSGNAQCFIDISGGTDLVANFVIADTHTSPIAGVEPPAAGEFRVVLTWGATPSDLDSHLTGPDGSGRFHVYYANLSFGGHQLDLDDVTAFGPETITIAPDAVDGVYRYSVHNFSEQSADGAEEIAQSPTTVRVYDSNGLIRTFVAPGPDADGGNTWRVFEMEIDGSSVTFDPVSSQNGLGYFLAANSGDTTVFLTGGEAAIEKR